MDLKTGYEEVIKKLKREIDALNNELDDLLEYKANFERMKTEYDKLSKNHEKILNEKLTLASPRKSSIAAANSLSPTPLKDDTSKSSHLELEWMKGENTKLTLELEKTEAKLKERLAQYNELKLQLAAKDEEMKSFIGRYEREQTTGDDLLNLQKKILELEDELGQERDERQKEADTNEKKHDEMLKRNDQLWSQKNTFQTKLDEALEVINEQGEQIRTLENKISDIEQVQFSLN